MERTKSKPGLALRWVARGIALAIVAQLLLIVSVRPTNDREWSADQTQLATALVTGDSVQIRNVRNAFYRSAMDYDVRWETREYDLRQLETAWFVVEPFANWRGPAHTLMSFGFANGEYLAISVEIRKERGETFSPLKGLLRQYEIAYVIGDERDLIGVRANHRHDAVYLYPVRATADQRRALFLSMLARANELAHTPQFYHTLTNNCTSSIVDHIEHIAPNSIPWSPRTILPAYADDLAFDLGLIDTELPRDAYRAAHKINDRAREFADRPDFSAGIRGLAATSQQPERP
jgi:hypothetical protein